MANRGRKLDVARLERLVEVWPEATSLRDACEKAGVESKDLRKMHRIRRKAEEVLGVTLPPINEHNANNFWDIECPSTLDLKLAASKKDFVITSLTSNNKAIKPFLQALQHFTEYRNGQFLVVPVRYRNPDAFHHDEEEDGWDAAITPFALTKDFHVTRKLVISSHRMAATAVNPLSGKHSLSGEKSAIYGHPQMAMELVGTPKNMLPKVMMTTGSCNTACYSATDAGGKAKHHHTVAAVYVKVVRGGFHYIQLGWDGKGFCYGKEYWTENGLEEPPKPAAIIHGDSHVNYEMPAITRSKLRLKELIAPEVQVFHDLHDHHRESHHETQRERVERFLKGQIFVEEEVALSVNYIERLGKGTHNLIVGANHNDHLDQWHGRFDARRDPANAKFHGWLSANMYGTSKSALQVCFDEWGCAEHYEFLDRSAPRSIYGVMIHNHGDKGTNGSRGSAKGFTKNSFKVVIGHSHTPRIEKSCWQTGTSTDLMPYAQGDSTWMLTDCLIYFNGKRALINHINGKTIFDYD